MKEIIDEDFSKRIPVIIRNSFGFVLPSTGVMFSFVLMACGGVLVATSGGMLNGKLIFGTFIFLVAGVGATLRSGAIIDTANRKMKVYVSFFGIKSGEWKDMSAYPYLTIFKTNLASTVSSRGNVSTKLMDVAYDVFLLTKNHRERVLIFTCDTKEKAQATAQVLAKKLDKEVVIYNPQSSRSRRR
jgi:hypothetical protein